MSYRGASSSASESPSPSSGTLSLKNSPALHSVLMSSGAEEAEGSSFSSPRASSARPHLTRPHSAGGTGGCWTCRLRRKKCDEQREGDSCQTCLRLKITCLGWGSRRPDWMRDKQAVKAYKEDIKAQLSRQGMIRGIPRSLPSTPSTPAGPSHALEPAIADPAQPSPGLIGPLGYGYSYGDSHFYQHGDQAAIPGGEPEIPGLGIYNDPTLNLPRSTTHPVLPEPSLTRTDVAQYPTYPLHTEFSGPHASSSAHTPNTVEEEHVLYYFQHVQRLQFVFAHKGLTDALYAIIVQEPRGAVTNSICAVASLHYNSTRIAQGLEAENPESDTSMVKRFYDKAYYQLATSKHMNGHYLDNDAIAALYLASFSLISNGPTEWSPMLDIACDWLVHTDLIVDENPKLCLLNMNYLALFAAKVTIWMDIFSSVTLMQPPRFLSLYRRLFGGGVGYWANSRRGGEESIDVGMESLTGCPDDVMLAIAEISALAHWKNQELRHGSLSVRELVRRGDTIDQQLLRDGRPGSASETGTGTPYGSRLPSPASASTSFRPASNPSNSSVAYTQDRGLVARMFRETAVLYLHTVLSDCNPGVPEILGSVNRMTQMIMRTQPSAIDRSILFPLFLSACMTDVPAQRQLFKNRLVSRELYPGSASQVEVLLEAVWKRRDSNTGAGPVNWREIMRELGLTLMLV